jgi:hypothetical protein
LTMTCIAYCILTYKEPERVARLVNRLQTDTDFMYIHFDTMIGKQRFKEWKKFIEMKCPQKNIEIVSKFRCKWGSFGQVDATLSAMKYYEDYNYDYFINLSGECYPLKPPEVIKKELNGQNCGFMEFFRIPYGSWWRGGLNRIKNRFYFIPRMGYPYVRIFSIPRLKKGLPCGLEPYGGRGGFCLPKEHVSYVIQFVEKNPNVRKFFKRTLIPDEIFFQTILMNSPLRSKVVNDNKRYIDFATKDAHPKILTKDDLGNMKKSGKLFARKFNLDVDKDILDIIDQEIEKAKVCRSARV